jgi:hypothetical protein
MKEYGIALTGLKIINKNQFSFLIAFKKWRIIQFMPSNVRL